MDKKKPLPNLNSVKNSVDKNDPSILGSTYYNKYNNEKYINPRVNINHYSTEQTYEKNGKPNDVNQVVIRGPTDVIEIEKKEKNTRLTHTKNEPHIKKKSKSKKKKYQKQLTRDFHKSSDKFTKLQYPF